ncbi:MAG: hypothetical protein AAF915_22925 [Cyanobacteria bacterium P01_D01_bin.50]
MVDRFKLRCTSWLQFCNLPVLSLEKLQLTGTFKRSRIFNLQD